LKGQLDWRLPRPEGKPRIGNQAAAAYVFAAGDVPATMLGGGGLDAAGAGEARTIGKDLLAARALARAQAAGALAGRGPFAIHSPNANLFDHRIGSPDVALAALVEERRGTAESLRQSEARMRIAAASTDTGLWQYDFANKDLWATEHCRSMFGCPPGATLTPELLRAAVLAEDRPIATAAMRAAQLPGEAPRRSDFGCSIPTARSAGIWRRGIPTLTHTAGRCA
jgi:hypothetical protein